ncbi:hypothetical protein ACFSKY_09240 [Azotobacter chroococcum]|jgi:hypothetical protein|uniref:Uncharacterized protein n=1 Tax=Azotobacter chroococcum TaxID=353 RepID=A0A4R1Q1K2_9GAMM|nr:hypothetical protein [Azotobacter chroococcum]TBV96175.1 hypothetical protein E0E53_10635 [Azotobacter chroococcum]TCL34295.1 hypothetical protein EV691_102279 [Azotobacter chroococcum]
MTPIWNNLTRAITTRAGLSFTGYTADEDPRFINWAPARVPPQPNQWNIEHRLGESLLEEVRTLHAVDEVEAFEAIQFALMSPYWKTGGAGAECGFATGLAALAVVGMRALRAGAEPFDPEAFED